LPRAARMTPPETGHDSGTSGVAPGDAKGRRPHGERRPEREVCAASLLEDDGRAGLLELSLGLVGGLLVRALEHGAGSAVDERLRLAQAEAREGTDLLDDLDLLVAGGLEDDVERVLLLGGGLATTGATGSGGGRGDGDGGGGGDLEGLLELLHELGQLDERKLLERLEQLVGA